MGKPPSDVDRFVYLQPHGEWLQYDAPWEDFGETLTSENEANIKMNFLKRCQAEKPIPQKSAAIVLKDSLRPCMMHVAEKVGHTYEGVERQLRQWQDHWLDLVHYGLLRREWETNNIIGDA